MLALKLKMVLQNTLAPLIFLKPRQAVLVGLLGIVPNLLLRNKTEC